MSSGMEPEKVASAVPLADLTIIDRALEGSNDELREAVKRVRPADLGRDLSRRSLDVGRRLLDAVDDRHGAAMLRAAHPAVAGQLVAAVPVARAGRVLAFLPIDHQVEILANAEPEQRAQIEAAMDPADRDTVHRLLAYDPLAVGRLMTPKIWRAALDQTAGDALVVLRQQCDNIEVSVNLYVVDGEKRPNQPDEQVAVPFCDPDQPRPPCWRPGERAEGSKAPLLPFAIDWLGTKPAAGGRVEAHCGPRAATAPAAR